MKKKRTTLINPIKYIYLSIDLYIYIYIFFIIIIIRFMKYQGNCRSSVAYRDNYPFINMISFIIDNSYK